MPAPESGSVGIDENADEIFANYVKFRKVINGRDSKVAAILTLTYYVNKAAEQSKSKKP